MDLEAITAVTIPPQPNGACIWIFAKARPKRRPCARAFALRHRPCLPPSGSAGFHYMIGVTGAPAFAFRHAEFGTQELSDTMLRQWKGAAPACLPIMADLFWPDLGQGPVLAGEIEYLCHQYGRRALPQTGSSG